jgi:hypothetical protein
MIGLPETPEVESKATPDTTDPKSTIAGEFERADQSNQANQDGVSEKLYLIGRPSLKQYIRYVRGHAVDGPDLGTLAEEWQAAANVVRALEKEEAGLADNPPLGKLGPEYEPLLIEFLKDPLVRHGFNTVPTEVAMVELDRMVVYQKHIDLTFVPQLESKLGPAPGRDEIFRTCLPYDHPQPPVKWSRVHHGHWVFVSPSNDLRFLGPMPISARHLRDYPRKGNLVGVVGLAVGFGSNFLNAIYAENRLILNNGSHRAYTLRRMGITHAPCIVQHVSTRDELGLVAPSEVRRHPDFFLKHPRPMMLKDYFNPLLYKVMKAHRRLHQVIVRFEVEENFVPAL